LNKKRSGCLKSRPRKESISMGGEREGRLIIILKEKRNPEKRNIGKDPFIHFSILPGKGRKGNLQETKKLANIMSDRRRKGKERGRGGEGYAQSLLVQRREKEKSKNTGKQACASYEGGKKKREKRRCQNFRRGKEKKKKKTDSGKGGKMPPLASVRKDCKKGEEEERVPLSWKKKKKPLREGGRQDREFSRQKKVFILSQEKKKKKKRDHAVPSRRSRQSTRKGGRSGIKILARFGGCFKSPFLRLTHGGEKGKEKRGSFMPVNAQKKRKDAQNEPSMYCAQKGEQEFVNPKERRRDPRRPAVR